MVESRVMTRARPPAMRSARKLSCRVLGPAKLPHFFAYKAGRQPNQVPEQVGFVTFIGADSQTACGEIGFAKLRKHSVIWSLQTNGKLAKQSAAQNRCPTDPVPLSHLLQHPLCNTRSADHNSIQT